MVEGSFAENAAAGNRRIRPSAARWNSFVFTKCCLIRVARLGLHIE
jgi:hypothetical protein